ncbi:MAG: ABC transporter permease [Planctomycetes bacterium]|nr:ABC transporter permease [Planctomycetota bacterium]
MKLVVQSTLRDLARHPWLAALCTLGIAASVGLVVAIDLAIVSSQRAFELSTDALSGKATHQISGAADGVSEDLYRALRLEDGLRDVAPVLEADLKSTFPEAGWLRILGIDPWAESAFRPGFRIRAAAAIGPRDLVGRPGTVLVSHRRARRLGLTTGSRIAVQVGGRTASLEVCGVYELEGEAESAPDDILIADLATAQELLAKVGKLSRIDLVIPDGAPGDEIRRLVEARLGPNLRLEEARRGADTTGLLLAFRQNLEFLSLLAVVVAAFLIYNTATFAVVRQRPIYGRLRCLGAARWQIVAAVLMGSLALGVLGTSLGLLGGVVLARGLVDIVSQTINDLYFVVSVNAVSVSAGSLIKGVALGIGATLLVTLPPAWEAASSPLRRVLSRADIETRAQARAPRWALLGLAVAVVGGAVLAWAPWGLWGCQLALALFVVAFAWMTPWVTLGLAAGLRAPVGGLFGVAGRMAASGIRTNLSRTGVAIAALGIALALTLSVGEMIKTFRRSVVDWLATTLVADVYVTVPRPVAGSRTGAELEPELAARLLTAPGIAEVTTNRSLTVEAGEDRFRLVVLGLVPDRPRGFSFSAGGSDAIWRDFETEDLVLASEPLATRRDLSVGDQLHLDTDQGVRPFRVAGVFRDFASEQGYLVMSRSVYETHWRDRAITALGLFARQGHDLPRELAEIAGSEHGLVIQSQAEIRRVSIEIFDRTFAITSVLRVLSAIVAFIGVLSALMSIQLERSREFGILRAAGLTRGGVARLGLVQSGLLGLIAGLTAVPLGLLFAWVLMVPVNRRSFGWTLPFEIDPLALIMVVAFGVLSAVVAGVLPSWALSRLEPAQALRGE